MITMARVYTKRPPEERFWEKVDIRGPEECWPWIAGRRNQYGVFGVRAGHSPDAHTYAYDITKGLDRPRRKGEHVDHICHPDDGSCEWATCRHTLCCNPAHLQLKSATEHVLRGMSPCAQNKRKTHCSRGHEYAGDNFYYYTAPCGTIGRVCRQCQKIRNDMYYAKHGPARWRARRST